MNKEVSLRQIAFLYLFISLSPILRQVPTALAREAGRSGYLSTIWPILAMIPLTGVIIALIKSFPGLNIYEIMNHLIGKFLSKLIILGYLLWILISIPLKINAYYLNLQFTLMARTKNSFFMIVLIFLVFYTLHRGYITVFRFSEFSLMPILILIGILFVSSLGQLRLNYLLPVSTIQLPETIQASINVISVGGYLVIALFFSDRLGFQITKAQIRKLLYACVGFIVLCFVITIFTFGITGADLTADLPYPFYITVKSISFFNIFERFEVLVTLICMLSDFIAVCAMSIILIRCFQWLFNLKESSFLYVPLTVFVYYLTSYISSTQFEFTSFYRHAMVNVNVIFQYIIPFFLSFITLLKRKTLQKQF